MKYLKFLPVLSLVLLTACVTPQEDEAAPRIAAAQQEVELDRPSFSAAQSLTVSATVEAIDYETRVVTLRREDGGFIEFLAGDDVRNLNQVVAGDIVIAEYVESISIEVMASDGLGADALEVEAMVRAEQGEMPGMSVVDATVVVATVEDINLEANTFKLKGPSGDVVEYTADDPENLTRAKVGDLVVITITESVTAIVEHQPVD